MPRFLITDFNSTYNKGDAAIVLGLIQIIKKFFPDSEITIFTGTPNEDKKYFEQVGVTTHLQLLNYVDRKIPPKLYAVYFLLKILWLFLCTKINHIPIRKKDKLILELYQKADLVISAAGGRLGERLFSQIVTELIPLYFATKIGKKVFVCAQSIEPFSSKILEFLNKFVLNRVEFITVREPLSLQVIQSLNVKTPTSLTADPAFLLNHSSPEHAKALLVEYDIPINNKILIGISVANLSRKKITKSNIRVINYINLISSSLEQIIEDTNAVIVFFPQVIFKPKEDDREISFLIKNTIKKSLASNVYVLEKNYSPEQLKTMMGIMNVFVGTRLHSCIFSLGMNVPTLVLGYGQKAFGTMKMLELEKYVLDINKIESTQIVTLVKNLLNHHESIKQKIKEKIPQIQNEAFRNGNYIQKLIS